MMNMYMYVLVLCVFLCLDLYVYDTHITHCIMCMYRGRLPNRPTGGPCAACKAKSGSLAYSGPLLHLIHFKPRLRCVSYGWWWWWPDQSGGIFLKFQTSHGGFNEDDCLVSDEDDTGGYIAFCHWLGSLFAEETLLTFPPHPHCTTLAHDTSLILAFWHPNA